MIYRVFSGPKGAPDPSPIEKQKMLFKEFASFDDALAWASHLRRESRVALAIDGDDGTRLNRREIGDALAAGQHAQIG